MKSLLLKLFMLCSLSLSPNLFAKQRALHVMVNSFEKGYVLQQDALSPAAAQGKDFEETLKKQKEFYLERITELNELRNHRLRDQGSPVSDTSVQTPVDVEVVSIDLPNLSNCLKIVLPLVSKQMALKAAQSDTSEIDPELSFIEAQLDLFRVQGKESYLCGEFYDAKDVVLMGELDQWKILLALKENLSDESRVLALVEALKAGYHLSSPIESRPLWQMITHLRIFQLAFGHEIESEEDLIEKLQADLVAREKLIGNDTISLKSAQIRPIFKRGLNFSRGLGQDE